MIIVRIELHSAITRQVTELARMQIENDGTGTARIGTYLGKTFRGRSREQLDRGTASRDGRVEDFPRQSQHVWNLVARMLGSMEYR